MPLDLSNLHGLDPHRTTLTFQRIQRYINDLEAYLKKLTGAVQAIPPVPSLPEIQQALSASGSVPLNLTGLIGVPTSVSNLPATPAVPPDQPGPPPTQGGFTIQFSKHFGDGRWPDVPFGTGNLQYTLWTVLFIAGQWYASGVIQYWNTLGESGGPPSAMSVNWFYGTDWGVMSGYQPAIGETVGFLVTAGNQRQNSNDFIVAERSNIVTLAYPAPPSATFDFTGMVDAIPLGSIIEVNSPPLAPMALTAELTQIATTDGAQPPP